MALSYLLDTCAWIDTLLAPEKLTASTRKLISSESKLGLASISLLEISRKEALGELQLTMPIAEWFEKIALPPGRIQLLPILPEIAIDSTRLPESFVNRQGKPHKDPADRLIVATARHHNLTILTSDQILLNYPHVRTLSSR